MTASDDSNQTYFFFHIFNQYFNVYDKLRIYIYIAGGILMPSLCRHNDGIWWRQLHIYFFLKIFLTYYICDESDNFSWRHHLSQYIMSFVIWGYVDLKKPQCIVPKFAARWVIENFKEVIYYPNCLLFSIRKKSV